MARQEAPPPPQGAPIHVVRDIMKVGPPWIFSPGLSIGSGLWGLARS